MYRAIPFLSRHLYSVYWYVFKACFKLIEGIKNIIYDNYHALSMPCILISH